MLKEAFAPVTSVPFVTVSAESIVGVEPSVVYTTRLVPEAPASPAVEIAIATGELVYQPPEQAPALQVSELVGALGSAWAVKLVPVLVRPALFVAVTDPLWVPAALVNV